jgi:hypothetical protein
METIKISQIAQGYRSFILTSREDIAKPSSYPQGFEPVLIGERLKIEGVFKYNGKDFPETIHGWGCDDAFFDDYYLVGQLQEGGYRLFAWMK